MITAEQKLVLAPPQPSRGDRPAWLEAMAHVVQQSPLIETRPSLEALDVARRLPAPRVVFVGIGLCTERHLGRGIPLDVLGLLLPAEQLRRAVGARDIVVLVADLHALENNLDRARVRALTRRWLETLRRLQSTVLGRLRVICASELHASEGYRAVLDEVRRRAPAAEHPYVVREVADVEHLRREAGGLLKVGWTVGPASTRRWDEVAFDRRFRSWLGTPAGFVYCRAGRALDDRRPKVPPYLVRDPEHRICLHPGEEVELKLARAAVLGRSSAQTIRGVRNHLRRIARVYSEVAHPLQGAVERRAQAIITTALDGSGYRT
jgi:hypothetical protein